MNKYKKMISLILVIVMVVLTGCSKNSNENGNENITDNSSNENNKNSEDTANINTSEQVKGGYVEESYPLPEGVTGILQMERLSDQTIRIVTYLGVYDSNDEGQSWTKNETIDTSMINEEMRVSATAIDKSGNIFINYSDVNFTVWNFAYLGADGNSKVMAGLPNEGYLKTASFSLGGDVVGYDDNDKLLVMNPTEGTIKREIVTVSGLEINSYACVGNNVLIGTESEIGLYEIETGSIIQTEETLMEFTKTINEGGGIGLDMVNVGIGLSLAPTVVAKDDGKSIYIYTRKGVFHYTLGGVSVEELVKGDRNTIGDSNYNFAGMTLGDDDSFQITYTGMSTVSFMNYRYSEDTATTPSIELKAYTLYKNDRIEQAITAYNKEHPDLYIRLEVGIGDDGSKVEGDAIRTLNTDLMSGKGPDLIFLDGLPIDSYIEQGVLGDISDVIEEVQNEEPLFDNIVEQFKKDGKIYQIPSRVSVPVVVGEETNLSKISDLKSFANEVVSIKEQNSNLKDITGLYSDVLLKILYNISSTTWMKEDGSLDQTKVKEYYEIAKQIQDIQFEGKSKEEKDELLGKEKYTESNSIAIMDLFLEKSKLSIMNVENIYTLGEMYSLNDQSGGQYDYKLAENDGVKPYIPIDILGVNGNSKALDLAKDFIKFYLSSDQLSTGLLTGGLQRTGFPINMMAYEKISINPVANEDGEDSDEFAMGAEEDANGEMKSFIGKWASPEIIQKFKSDIESLNTPTITDHTIEDTIIEEGKKFLEGEGSSEDAASNALKSINLYLAE